MVRSQLWIPALGLTPIVLGLGCSRNQKENLMIPDVPFGHYKAVETPSMPKVSPATTESAIRAGKMGQKIVEANKEYGIRPSIHTIGGEQFEVFHRGQDQIFITEGLVRQSSDPQLAAIISMEMAKMVSEREALEGPMTRNFATSPPQQVIMFEDRGGTFGAPDGTHLAELAKYERRRGGPRRSKLKLPDPPVLANAFLKKSGFGPEALASAQPLLQRAQEQSSFEKQMRGSTGVVPVEARTPIPTQALGFPPAQAPSVVPSQTQGFPPAQGPGTPPPQTQGLSPAPVPGLSPGPGQGLPLAPPPVFSPAQPPVLAPAQPQGLPLVPPSP